jgi:hypothetical protein
LGISTKTINWADFNADRPQPPVLPVELVAGPTVAYRAWYVWDGRLKSTSTETVWPAGEPLAGICLNQGVTHHVAAPGCSCGIYALKAPRFGPWPGCVGGRVALWGRVIEHDDGYRAEYAYPVSLFRAMTPRPPGFPRVATALDALAAAYGVPIEPAPVAPTPPCAHDWEPDPSSHAFKCRRCAAPGPQAFSCFGKTFTYYTHNLTNPPPP